MASKTIGQVIEEGRLKRFMDPRLIKALGHPVREHILAVLNERVASPTEIGKEIGLEVEAFYHHVEVLEEFGCIERVETRQRRGAKEHFFRAKTSFFFDDSGWKRVPTTMRSDMSASDIQSIFNDALSAILGGTLGARGDSHVTWLPGGLDERGWREQLALLNYTVARSIAIHEASTLRVATTGAPVRPGTVAILGFETPAPAQSIDTTATPWKAHARG